MSPRVRPNNYGFWRRMCRVHDTAIFAILYLILLTLWFHKNFKLIFLNQSSCMYAEYWRKLAWATFLGNFAKLLVLQFKLCFQSKISFDRLFWLYSNLVPPFYFLKWNRFFSTFIPTLRESRHYFNYLLPREVCTNL